MRRRDVITIVGGCCSLLAAYRERARAGPHLSHRLSHSTPRVSPPIAALLDELRLNCFNENKNLEILPSGFDARGEAARGTGGGPSQSRARCHQRADQGRPGAAKARGKKLGGAIARRDGR